MIRLYVDAHVPASVTVGLRLRDEDVLTAQEDGADHLPDSSLLDRATELGRVLFTEDRDLLVEAKRRPQLGQSFSGIIYIHQFHLSYGRRIADLEVIAKAGEPEDLQGMVQYLPL